MKMIPKVEIPESKEKIEHTISALEHLIETDDPKSKEIHKQAIKDLQAALSSK